MVFKRFLTIILVLGTALKLCNASSSSSSCHDTSRDLNTKWRAADVLQQLGHDVYQSLALGPFDANDPEKRFASVFGQALFQFLISNASTEEEMVREAVRKTKKLVQKPANVLSGQMRAVISLMFSIVELPLTDVQKACPYKVCEADCKKNLANLQAEKIKSCPGYKYSITMYDIAIKFVTSCDLHNLLQDMVIAVNKQKKPSDKAALAFFGSTLAKYPDAMHLFKNVFIYMNSVPKSQICTMFSFL